MTNLLDPHERTAINLTTIRNGILALGNNINSYGSKCEQFSLVANQFIYTL